MSLKAKRQGIAAFFILVVFVLAALNGILFVTEESNHDCIGEGCSVCCTIQHLEELFHSGKTPEKPAAIPAFAFCSSVVIFTLYKCFETKRSLVSLKVKLSD